MATHEPDKGDRPVLDFGRGSREQSQGGPGRANVHPIRERVDVAEPRA